MLHERCQAASKGLLRNPAPRLKSPGGSYEKQNVTSRGYFFLLIFFLLALAACDSSPLPPATPPIPSTPTFALATPTSSIPVVPTNSPALPIRPPVSSTLPPVTAYTPSPIAPSPTPDPRPLSPTLNPKVAWQVQLDGIIAGAAAIADGVLYIATQEGAFYALDAATGDEKWQADVDGTISGSIILSRNTLYASGSFSGGGTRQGGVIALDAQDGSELWRYTGLGEAATPPLLADSLLIFGSDDDKVYAVDTAIAEERWTYDAGAPLDTAPVSAGGTIYIGDATGTFQAINAANGTLKWKLDAGRRERILPLAYTTLTSGNAENDVVYFSNVLDGPVYAVDAATGNERWRFAITGLMTPVPSPQPSERNATLVTSPPAVSGDSLYVGLSFGLLGLPAPDRIGYLYALDAATGKERWKVVAETQITGRPIIQGSAIYYAANAGIVHAADVATGRDLWHFEAEGPINAPLLLSDNTLYFGTFGGVLYALQLGSQ